MVAFHKQQNYLMTQSSLTKLSLWKYP